MIPTDINVASFYLDWGDGSPKEKTIKNLYTHTYTDGIASHQVQIGNCIKKFGHNSVTTSNNLTEISKMGNNIEEIGAYAFENCTNLTSINLYTDSVQEKSNIVKIGDGCFKGCSKLNEIAIPDSVEYLGTQTFCNCHRITKIKLSDNIKHIYIETFSNCGRLVSINIPSKLESIRTRGFTGCASLLSVYLPATLSVLGNTASAGGITGDVFTSAPKLSIYVDENNPYYSSDSHGALFNKNKTELAWANAVGPTYTIPETVTFCDSYAFRSNNIITDLHFSKNINRINSGFVMHHCNNLTSITIDPENESFTISSDLNGNYALYDVNNKNNIQLTKLLCSSKGKYIIPEGVKHIKSIALNSFSKPLSVVFPTTLSGFEDIGLNDNFKSIEISAENETFSAGSGTSIYNKDKSVMYLGDYNESEIEILDSVIEIKRQCFPSFIHLTKMSMKDDVKILGYGAFSGCSNLSSIILSKNIERFNGSTFYKCGNLSSITLPVNLKYLNNQEFLFCGQLTGITFPDNLKSIGSDCFLNCPNLKNIYFPNSITSINDTAFLGCGPGGTVSKPTVIFNKTMSNVKKLSTNKKYWGLKEGTQISCTNGTITVE